MRSKAWLAAPVLLAHNRVQNLGTPRYCWCGWLRHAAIWAQVAGCCSHLRRRCLLLLQLSSLGKCLLSNAMGCKCMLLCMCMCVCCAVQACYRARAGAANRQPHYHHRRRQAADCDVHWCVNSVLVCSGLMFLRVYRSPFSSLQPVSLLYSLNPTTPAFVSNEVAPASLRYSYHTNTLYRMLDVICSV